ncbi:FAST kinase domain-containing protein 3, mitochondrial [Synchiropus splendidus]|uniref:FAST kinase domain-containing protein 3, mitochondrial n=1 Tax=Synchiropus splendidus TaxID=270530 RepID=UPI00237E8D62|nr:FAST kinase domain-containing protein 3, mitochondrial [Synchiropus splendidus]
MAQKVFLKSLTPVGQFGVQRYLPTGYTRLLRLSKGPCVTCLGSSAASCIQKQGCRRLHLSYRSLTSIVREPSFIASSSVGLHRDSIPRFCLTQLHRPSTAEEQAFQESLARCASCRLVFKLLQSVEMMSDTMAAAVLHRVADLEREGNSLRDPSVLENDAIRALCLQLEQDAARLTDAGLASALLACTRLFLDPSSSLMVHLVSESQERLDRGRMAVGPLCDLGRAAQAMSGPDSVLLSKVIQQIQQQEPSSWSPAELVSVYRLLEGGVDAEGKCRELLNAMHTQAVTAAHSMDPAAVSGLFNTLRILNQSRVMPLVISLCKQAVRHVPHFSDAELNQVLEGLMHFGHSDRYFVEAIERIAPKMAFTSDPETVTKVVEFFSRRNILSTQVFDAIAESFVYRAEDYSTSQVSRQLRGFGKLGYLPPDAVKLFGKVELILRTRFSQFQPRALLNLLHSCILVERFPVNYVSKVFSSFFLQQLEEEGAGMNRTALAQLTQLYVTVKLECPFYTGPKLPPKYHVKSFLSPGQHLETPVHPQLDNSVKVGLVDLLGYRSHFGSRVLTPYCYTLDVEIKLDEEGYVLPASQDDAEVFKRIALCIDGQERFTSSTRQLLGKEATKQRHLRLLGYEVVQIPFYEFEKLQTKDKVVEYLHKKIFPHSYRLSW